MDKKILDMTCGSRTIWFNKNHPAAVYCDKRREDYELYFGRARTSLHQLHVYPDYADCNQCIMHGVVKRLPGIPAADVVPAAGHGRWIVSRTDYGWNSAEFPTHSKCSLCGREIPYQDRDNYCPNCGAKMDKDGDGE